MNGFLGQFLDSENISMPNKSQEKENVSQSFSSNFKEAKNFDLLENIRNHFVGDFFAIFFVSSSVFLPAFFFVSVRSVDQQNYDENKVRIRQNSVAKSRQSPR